MCTFGANNTETPLNNSLIDYNNTTSTISAEGTDVASMILPEKGVPVPHFGDM